MDRYWSWVRNVKKRSLTPSKAGTVVDYKSRVFKLPLSGTGTQVNFHVSAETHFVPEDDENISTDRLT